MGGLPVYAKDRKISFSVIKRPFPSGKIFFGASFRKIRCRTLLFATLFIQEKDKKTTKTPLSIKCKNNF